MLLRRLLFNLAVFSSRGHLEPSWRHLGAILGHLGAMLGHLGTIVGHLGTILDRLGSILGPSWRRLGAILTVLEASWRPSWAILAILEAGCVDFARDSGWPAESAEAPLGFFWKGQIDRRLENSARQAPLRRLQGAADRRRLRRITAAPCLLERAVSQMSSHIVGTCSPRPCGNLRGNVGGEVGAIGQRV